MLAVSILFDDIYLGLFLVCCGFEFLGALLCLVLTVSPLRTVGSLFNTTQCYQIYFRVENARRDRVYGVPEKEKIVDTRELADKVYLSPRWVDLRLMDNITDT